MDAGTFYITTPIYYVNGLPHIGHAYTTIAADTLVRWHRLRGHNAFFLTGTDEHGQKVLEKARSRDMTPKAHCDDMVVHWKAMWDRLRVRPDRFIRTTDADHQRVVEASLQKLWDEGLIYRAEYEGWYYIPDEVFVTDKDVEDGKYDRSKLTRLKEANYFFKMSQYRDQLVAHIEANPSFVRPEMRRNEVLGFLRKDLGDLCISRPKARMSWGIDIPFDREYVTYVWFDALLNYLSGIGWHPDASLRQPGWHEKWANCVHLLGKDILTTHAVYWSTMLMALGVPLPKGLYAHGWWTASDGSKISKSLGNTIDVGLLAEAYGVDGTRFFFLREIAFGSDGGFSYEGFQTRYNADLANDLGNLAHRGLSMTSNWLGAQVPAIGTLTEADHALIAVASRAVAGFADGLDDLQFHRALESLWELVRAGNKYVDTEAPWALNKAGNTDRLATVMRVVLEVCAISGALLLPVMPDKASELLGKLSLSEADVRAWLPRLLDQAKAGAVAFDGLTVGASVVLGEPLFPRFRELPEPIVAALAAIPEVPVSEPKAEPKTEAKPAPEAAAPAEAAPAAEALITYDDFAKIKLRSGKVVAAEKHPKADRLLVLQVDVGEAKPRTIVAGIASKFAPEELVGRQVVVVINLAPAKLRGVMSEGMLLAAGGEAVIDLVSVNANPGEIVR